MVSKSSPNLQRRHRGCAPRDLAPSDFFHVPAKPRQYRNSAPYLEPNGKCTRSRHLNRPKTSLGECARQLDGASRVRLTAHADTFPDRFVETSAGTLNIEVTEVDKVERR